MRTLKLAHASDLHCTERQRLDDWIGLHEVLVGQIREARCDLALLTGDLFHAKSAPAERNAMAGLLVSLAEYCPVHIVKGNHDAAGDLDIYSCLSAHHPITLRDRPGTEVIDTVSGGVAVYSIPWFDKAHLVAGLAASVDAEATRNLTIEAARGLLTVARAHLQHARDSGAIPILAAHVIVGGAETSTGQTLIGTSVELAPGDLADVGAEYVALGHIHKAQEWADGRIAYAGSTWRQNFGEPEPKGWRLVTCEDGRFASAQFMELPARRIILIETDRPWDADAVIADALREYEVRGALTRLRYHVAAERLHEVDEDSLRGGLLNAGAADAKLEAVVVAETRVRSEAILTARDNMDRLRAYLDAKGIVLDPGVMERIADKLAQIEGRAREEAAHEAA